MGHRVPVGTGVRMLRKFHVHNFKTLLDFTFEPEPISLLIGRNNVGKTTVCQALRFLSLTPSMKLLNACVATTGSATSFTNKHSDESSVQIGCQCELAVDGESHLFEYDLAIDMPQAGGQPRLVSETLDVTGPGQKRRTLLHVTDGQVDWPDEERAEPEPGVVVYDGGRLADLGTTALSHLRHQSPKTRLAWRFKSYLESWDFYDLENARLRDTRCNGGVEALEADGCNLAAVVASIKARDDRAYGELLEFVRLVEPEVEAITFEPSPDPKQVFMAFEDGDRRQFRPHELSNGTLRMLALGAIVASRRSAALRSGLAPGLTMLEEPATGIFVRHLRGLLEALDDSGTCGQYLFTSHQPYLIDLFDKWLDAVFVLKRDGERTSLIRPDPTEVRGLLETFSLGELHFREMLG